MRRIMKSSKGYTAADTVNMFSASALQTHGGQVLTVVAAALFKEDDTEDEVGKESGYIVFMEDGVRKGATFISKSAINCVDAIIDYMDSEDLLGIDVQVTVSKSKNNRDYITLMLV